MSLLMSHYRGNSRSDKKYDAFNDGVAFAQTKESSGKKKKKKKKKKKTRSEEDATEQVDGSEDDNVDEVEDTEQQLGTPKVCDLVSSRRPPANSRSVLAVLGLSP